MFAGEHVKLRPVERGDIEAVRGFVNNPETRKFIYMRHPVSRFEEERWFENGVADRENLLLVITDKKGAPIGSIGLHGIDYGNCKATLGILIGEEANLGKGYGREAIGLLLDFCFGELNLDTVQLETYDFNERAQKCYLAAGFKSDGWERSKIFKGGRRIDLMQMSVTREDWAKSGKERK